MKENVGIPVIANGDVCTEEDVARIHELTKVDGTPNPSSLRNLTRVDMSYLCPGLVSRLTRFSLMGKPENEATFIPGFLSEATFPQTIQLACETSLKPQQ